MSVAFTSNNTLAATVTATPIVFTSVNYNTPQTVTVAPVEDQAATGTRSVQVSPLATSTDAFYNNIATPKVAVTVNDNDRVRAPGHVGPHT